MIEVRLRFCGRRERFDVPDKARADALRIMAKALTDADTNPDEAEALLRGAATATPEKLRAMQNLVAVDTAAGLPEATPQAGPDESFAKYAERWFDDRERRGLSSVATDRGRIVKHVNPTLGRLEIRAVQRDDLRALVERLDDSVRAQSINWSTAKKVWGLVTKLFDDACRGKVAALRVRDDNPARDVRGPDEGEPTAKQWLYPDEVLQLLEFAEVPLRWRRLYALATYLYLRPGELAALEWKDVHLKQGYVHIHQALDLRTRTDKPKATKTGVSCQRAPKSAEI